MRLDAARGLKQALLAGTALPDGLVDRAEAITALATEPGAFVGIVPSSDAEGYRVAVRLTRPRAEPLAASPGELAGANVDVRYVGPVRALGGSRLSSAHSPGDLTGGSPPTGPPAGTEPTPEELQQRMRPLVRGASIAHRDVSAGTIGAFVTVDEDSAIYLLSNNHVLADSDRGRPGDDVLQPGPADGGTAADRAGELLRAVPLTPDEPNLIDAAIARLDEGIEVDLDAHDGPLGDVVEASDIAAVVGDVAKIGRTTGLTLGRVSAIEVDGVPVGYATGVLVFDDQIEVEGIDAAFSAGGDSGSVIYTAADRRGVGLLFAGSTAGGPGDTALTYANPLGTALSALGAALASTEGSDEQLSSDRMAVGEQ